MPINTNATLRVRIYNGSRQLFAAPASFLITITDGTQTQQIRDEYPNPDTTFTNLSFFDNYSDNYSVNVYLPGYQQAGYFPVHVSDKFTVICDIMLIANNPGFSFVNARWPAASAAYPFLIAGADPVTAQARYENFSDQEEPSLACLLNLTAAMSQIVLPQDVPLDYFKALVWDPIPGVAKAPAQDRFFAWCDKALVEQVHQAALAGHFTEELNPGALHPGATRSWKQNQFSEANVQITFHEGAVHPTQPTWTIVEPDMDYFPDAVAHVLLEVLPNTISGALTNPAIVYLLRWMAGRTPNCPGFVPLCTLR